jgi:hypothetical protein
LIHKVMEYGEAMGLEMIQVITKTPREFPSLGSNRTKPGASLPGFRDSQTGLRIQREPAAKLRGDQRPGEFLSSLILGCFQQP